MNSIRPDAFEEFTEAWQKYATLTAEIYTDKDAPHSVAAILGRAAGKVGLAVARQVPVVGLPLQFVDDDALAEPAAEVATYLAGRFDDSEDRRLVADPVPVMTPLFLQGITRLAKDLSPVLVCFDSFEKTLPFIEGWLRRLLDGGYGGLQRR